MKYLTLKASLIGLCAVSIFIEPAQAANPHNNDAKVQKSSARHLFSDHDIEIIRDYYSDNYQGNYQNHHHDDGKKKKKLPPGLQKKYQRTGQLPPGWQKKLARGEVMPLDIYEVGRPIPVELHRRLPIGPIGSKVLEIEGKIFRVIENTREIIDILDLNL